MRSGARPDRWACWSRCWTTIRKRPFPSTSGLQTATVVGLPESAATSTSGHHVRIQFPWQRGIGPNSGGLAETGSSTSPEGHAPGNDTTATWKAHARGKH